MSIDLRTTFGVDKPVIAMAHIPPMPATPLYDAAGGPDAIVEAVRRDVAILVDGGVDAVMFCNEGDRPYQLRAGFEGVAMLSRVVTECRPSSIPFGVDFLWDPRAALSVAAVTGASFIREVATGVYESDMGLWAPDAADLLRYRRTLDAEGVAVFMNVTPEFASPIGRRTTGQVARSVVVSSLADAILVSGPMAGSEPDLEAVREAKDAVAGDAPVLLNTGAKSTNIRAFLGVADGVIVGSDLKVDGYTWNPVDPARVEAFIAAAHAARDGG
jgi:membrane complex biogenesis BtpA family protein